MLDKQNWINNNVYWKNRMVAERATKHMLLGRFLSFWYQEPPPGLLKGCVYTPCILSTVSVVRVVLRHKYISSYSTSNSRHEPCCRMDTKRQLVVVHNRASSLTWPGVPRDGDSLGSVNSGSWCSDVTDAVPEVCRYRKDLTVQCYQRTSWRRGGYGGFVRVVCPSC